MRCRIQRSLLVRLPQHLDPDNSRNASIAVQYSALALMLLQIPKISYHFDSLGSIFPLVLALKEKHALQIL
jgi:hypothetical protein